MSSIYENKFLQDRQWHIR